MEPIGLKIAEGRDSEIFEHGPGKVLRSVSDGRSMVAEAEIMSYVGARGYPVPEIHDAGDGYIVMDRIEGPTLLRAATKPPFRLKHSATVLAELHRRLHDIHAPEWLPVAPVPGDRVLHLDLHPLNVLLSDRGPVVIDWSNAGRGDPAVDVADMWITLRCAEVPGSPVERAIGSGGKRLFLRYFLAAVGHPPAPDVLLAAAAARLDDSNWNDDERRRLEALVKATRSVA